MMTRRTLLLGSGAPALFGQSREPAPPLNQSYPLRTVQGNVTPAESFFTRDHFHEPSLSLSDWRLKVEGRVARPLELTFADLLESPSAKVQSVLECAGNIAGGSAAGNAVWEGVALSHLLERAGPGATASMVLLEGADHGRLGTELPDAHYGQIVSLSKCLQASSLIAWKLNGSFLPRKSGFPARVVLPGWYGMDWVKWLTRIVVLAPSDADAPLRTTGMDKLYNRITANAAGERTTTRLSELQVKSVVAWPPPNARLPIGNHQVYGFAWTGDGTVRSVAVSQDEGKTWADAALESKPSPWTWVRWKFPWRAAAGDHVLMSRATDDKGNQQPLTRDPARKDGYEMNFCERVRCSVR